MTTPISITSATTGSQMHNNIMAVGSRNRPPMLATGRYAQCLSRLLRYIDTKQNGDALRKCILEAVETILTMSPENKAHYESEKEEIHLLLIGIGDEIYSTVDACKTAHEMWIAIERLQQVSSTTSTRMVKYQKEVNEIRAERIAKNASPLVLVAATQQYPDPYYQALKSHKPYAPSSKQASSTRSNASTKFKGKEIAKPITPPSESASEEDSDPEQAQRDKDMQKNLALIAKYFKKIYKPTNNNLRTSSNSRNKNVDTTQRYKNDNQTGQFGNQRTMTVAWARETVGSQVVQQTGIQCFNCKEFEQADWLEATDEEIDEQELEAHYSYMAKIQEHSEQPESTINTCLVAEDDSNVTPASPEMCDNDILIDQNAEDERAALANLIANLKLDVDENKKIQKQLKKANASLTQELKE
ncbi:hypothetical protein Tco_0722191 [Tanacetum coccineum]